MFTTNKDTLFKGISKKEKDLFYNISKTTEGIRLINKLKNITLEDKLNNELVRLFPKSRAIKVLTNENVTNNKDLYRSNTEKLSDLGLHKHDIFVYLKKHKLF